MDPEEEEETIRCLALPIVGDQVLVPNAVVAEVFAAEEIAPAQGGPEWLLGSLDWRGRRLPLVCMEAALGGRRPEAGARAKVVVMKALTRDPGLTNYAVLVQGIPHQVLATGQLLTREAPVNGARPFVAADLQVDGRQAFIPDLDAVERALGDAADSWRPIGHGGGGGDAVG